MIVPAAIVVAAAPCSSSSSSAVAVVVPALPLARPMATSVVIFIAVAVVSAVAAALGRHFLVDKKRESQKYSEQGGGGRRRKKKNSLSPLLFTLSTLSLSLSLASRRRARDKACSSLSLSVLLLPSVSLSLPLSLARTALDLIRAGARESEREERKGGTKNIKKPIHRRRHTSTFFLFRSSQEGGSLSEVACGRSHRGGTHSRLPLRGTARANRGEGRRKEDRRLSIDKGERASRERERRRPSNFSKCRPRQPCRTPRRARSSTRRSSGCSGAAHCRSRRSRCVVEERGRIFFSGRGEREREDVFFLASMVKTFRRRSSAKNDDNAHFLSFPTSKKPLSLSLSLSSPLFFFFFFHNTGALRHGP